MKCRFDREFVSLFYLRVIIGGRELLSFLLFTLWYLGIAKPIHQKISSNIWTSRWNHVYGYIPSFSEEIYQYIKYFRSKHIDSLRLLPFYSSSSLCLYGGCKEWLQYDSIINLCNTNDKNMSMEAQFIILFFLPSLLL